MPDVAPFQPSLSAQYVDPDPWRFSCVGWGFEAGYYLRHPATRQARMPWLDPSSPEQAPCIEVSGPMQAPRPRLLDLFGGAGGAAEGYARAGFEVVGVDIVDQPNYPFGFVRMDALEYLHYSIENNEIRLYDAIHASPPCPRYSSLKGLVTKDYPALIEEVRELLRATGLPYVIENVVGAPLLNPIKLCGSSFGLGVWRHRLFECSFPIMASPCQHYAVPEPIDVTGTGGRRVADRQTPGGNSRKPRSLEEAREAMGIDWMTRAELSEAIPPAYTEWVGSYLIAHLNHVTEEATA